MRKRVFAFLPWFLLPALVFGPNAQAEEYDSPPPIIKDEPTVIVLIPNASFFSRYELREGYDTIGRNHPRFRESDMVFYRSRFGLSTSPSDIGKDRKIALRWQAQASGFWADRSSTLSDSALGLHQAVIRLSGDGYWLDAGRFEMAYGEHLVIGNVGWHQTGRSFDGLRSHHDVGKGWIDLFVTQVAEDPEAVKPFAGGDQYFSGIYAGLGPLIGTDTELDTYFFQQIAPRDSADSEIAAQFTLGSRIKQTIGNSFVRAETGLQLGVGAIDQLAFHGDIELGTHFDQTHLGVGAWYASGDDPSSERNEGWDPLYPTGHKLMGLADIIGGRTNIAGALVRAKQKLSSLSLGVDAHLFLRPETPEMVNSLTAFEFDTWGLQNLGKGLGLRVGYSLFVPQESGSYGTSSLAHYLEVQLKYTLQ